MTLPAVRRMDGHNSSIGPIADAKHSGRRFPASGSTLNEMDAV